MTEFGTVSAWLEPTIPLVVRGPSGVELPVTAVVDTGFSGTVSLPTEMVTALSLVRERSERVRLADGSLHRFELYRVQALWCGEWVDLLASSLGGEVLLGMAMLAGRGLWVEAHPGGIVEVRPLAANGG